jgi:signal transduction histidine kinase
MPGSSLLAGTAPEEIVDVNELIQEMVAMLQNEANRDSITIRTDLAKEIPNVMADRVQLQQVLMNLMLNGIDGRCRTTGELSIKSQGTGLGLAITRSIIESHGGCIWATGNLGAEATFHFTPPFRDAAV